MKKEDMEKERQSLLTNIGIDAAIFLEPLARILGAVGRVHFLQSEISKVTPKLRPEPNIGPEAKIEMEASDDKMDCQKATV